MNHKYNRKLNESVKEAIRRIVLKEANMDLGSMANQQPFAAPAPEPGQQQFSSPYMSQAVPTRPPGPSPVVPPNHVPRGVGKGRGEFIGGQWYYITPDGRYYWYDHDANRWWDMQNGQYVD